MTASYEVHGNIAVITMNNPPVNGLGFATRHALAEGLERSIGGVGIGGDGHVALGEDRGLRRDTAGRLRLQDFGMGNPDRQHSGDGEP